ncbi:MAG TPA: hypothetical protein ENI61_05055 [Ignavibacteria bacterium]|nr:hypothetical protein [Ignavibacteria bacterium]
MRAGFVNRTDIPNGLYIDDIENTSQRNFSSQPVGQSRILRRPSDTELVTVLDSYAFLTIVSNLTSATFDTTIANGTLLNIRDSSTGSFTQISVTSSATLSRVQVVADLNLAFKNAKLGFIARLDATNHIVLDTVKCGPSTNIEISATLPSAAALHTVLGLSVAVITGLSIANLRSAVYPTSTTLDVSSATIEALSTFSSMESSKKTILVDSIAESISPHLAETSLVLLSFVNGVLGKASSASFQPGGPRIGLPVGPAIAILKDDGTTTFTI